MRSCEMHPFELNYFLDFSYITRHIQINKIYSVIYRIVVCTKFLRMLRIQNSLFYNLDFIESCNFYTHKIHEIAIDSSKFTKFPSRVDEFVLAHIGYAIHD